MPYIWNPVYDVLHTAPPGRMEFRGDWGINPIYDEVTNPNPITELIFNARTVFRPDVADVSYSRIINRHFNAGYVWLLKSYGYSDDYFEELRYPRQYLFGHSWIDIRPISIVTFSEARFDSIVLDFNPAKIESVRLTAYAPPTWQD